mmetsp:Transcript_22700/g.56262  ORF Transcript_22700/g.56262 Transcript_22700/m.56262 type:complete len:208 (-) Transcript_22700:319-942(-)
MCGPIRICSSWTASASPLPWRGFHPTPSVRTGSCGGTLCTTGQHTRGRGIGGGLAGWGARWSCTTRCASTTSVPSPRTGPSLQPPRRPRAARGWWVRAWGSLRGSRRRSAAPPLWLRTWGSSLRTLWSCAKPSARLVWWCCSLPGGAADAAHTCLITTTRTPSATRAHTITRLAKGGTMLRTTPPSFGWQRTPTSPTQRARRGASSV